MTMSLKISSSLFAATFNIRILVPGKCSEVFSDFKIEAFDFLGF